MGFETKQRQKELQKICPKPLSKEQNEAFLRIKHLLDLSDAILMETHPEDMNEFSCRRLSVIDKTILREARKLTKNKENEK